jgi:hypothetical protein
MPMPSWRSPAGAGASMIDAAHSLKLTLLGWRSDYDEGDGFGGTDETAPRGASHGGGGTDSRFGHATA